MKNNSMISEKDMDTTVTSSLNEIAFLGLEKLEVHMN